MGIIKLSVVSKAPVESLYSTGRSVYDLVEHLPNIKDIRVMESSADGNFSVAEWILDIKLPIPHGKLSWLQELHFNDDEKYCRFRLSPKYSGIVKRFDGLARYLPRGGGAEIIVEMDFRVEHPLVSPAVHRIFDGIMRKNHEALLAGIKKKAESRI